MPPPGYKLYGRDEEAPKPPPPVVGSYTAFGAEHSTAFVEPPFEQSMMYRRDGPGVDLRSELRSLNGEVLERFIALIDDVRENPSAYERRVEEITLLFNNMHHLLNAIRPSQAYATLGTCSPNRPSRNASGCRRCATPAPRPRRAGQDAREAGEGGEEATERGGGQGGSGAHGRGRSIGLVKI